MYAVEKLRQLKLRVAEVIVEHRASVAWAGRLGLAEQLDRLFEVLAADALGALGVTLGQPAAQAAEQRSGALDGIAAAPRVHHADQRLSESESKLVLPIHPQQRSFFVTPGGVRSSDGSGRSSSRAAGG
jgi:hypothetical protein